MLKTGTPSIEDPYRNAEILKIDASEF